MNPLNIAIIGSGTAGSSAALYLSKQGYNITVFEREKDPKPVGAGIMLQPTGLKCLQELGLKEKALELGTPIYGVSGFTEKNIKIIDIDLNISNNLYGLGIHRSALYFLLFNELSKKSIKTILNAEILSIEGENSLTLTDSFGNKYSDFDLVICANGAQSKLRQKYTENDNCKIQPYGALWAKIEADNNRFKNKIIQKYKGSYRMVGFMPIGKINNSPQEYVNFFWSIKYSEMENWKKEDNFENWKQEVKELIPEYADLIDKIKTKDEIMIAPYRDAVLKPFHKNNVLFIGDAAHPMSPQFSQGASFALLDAKILSQSLHTKKSVQIALHEFQNKRSNQVYFYQELSRKITPMFQSDAENPWFRNHIFKLLCNFRLTKNLITDIVLGYRKNYFEKLEKDLYL